MQLLPHLTSRVQPSHDATHQILPPEPNAKTQPSCDHTARSIPVCWGAEGQGLVPAKPSEECH